ncbi:uncharacterized protein LOC133186472 [Saccostrea echinata]|uniref:uncharacterized protein LOC133186472 n=1 Tax=Saccostrea echinata TaxID=191078 RepID=UPI002A809145|nr:uncharacterized protein LOC133186472 [Saccostrea echinata]
MAQNIILVFVHLYFLEQLHVYLNQNTCLIFVLFFPQSNEVPNSSLCEHEGLKRSVRFLKDEGLELDTLITDRHRQNNKWIKENLDGTNHFYDIWHVAKGTGKKLDALAKVKDCDIVGKWKQSITNHMYWSAGCTPDNNADMIVAKWESVIQHVQNIHTNHQNALFQSCLHDPLEDDEREIKWLNPSIIYYAYSN